MLRVAFGLVLIVGGAAGLLVVGGTSDSTTVVFFGVVSLVAGLMAMKPPGSPKAPHEQLIAEASDKGRVAELKSRLDASPDRKAAVDELLTRHANELDTIAKLDLVLNHLRRN